jgi:hypothetical protein
MNLEEGIYDAEVIFEKGLSYPTDYDTPALFQREECERCDRCDGNVKLIFPRAYPDKKHVDINVPFAMFEANICPGYADRILSLKGGKLLINIEDAWNFGDFFPDNSNYKLLLERFNNAMEGRKCS